MTHLRLYQQVTVYSCYANSISLCPRFHANPWRFAFVVTQFHGIAPLLSRTVLYHHALVITQFHGIVPSLSLFHGIMPSLSRNSMALSSRCHAIPRHVPSLSHTSRNCIPKCHAVPSLRGVMPSLSRTSMTFCLAVTQFNGIMPSLSRNSMALCPRCHTIPWNYTLVIT